MFHVVFPQVLFHPLMPCKFLQGGPSLLPFKSSKSFQRSNNIGDRFSIALMFPTGNKLSIVDNLMKGELGFFLLFVFHASSGFAHIFPISRSARSFRLTMLSVSLETQTKLPIWKIACLNVVLTLSSATTPLHPVLFGQFHQCLKAGNSHEAIKNADDQTQNLH